MDGELTSGTAAGYPVAVFSYVRRRVPDGDAGTRETLDAMATMIRREALHPLVREAAWQVRQWRVPGEALGEAVRRWVNAHFTFVPDPVHEERLHTPEVQLRQIRMGGVSRGDCDDAAVLAGAVAASLGMRTRLVVVAFLDKRAPFSHVWVEVAPSTGLGAWIECDVTRPMQSVPLASITRVQVVPVTEGGSSAGGFGQ